MRRLSYLIGLFLAFGSANVMAALITGVVPSDVAYTDKPNTFTSTQTFTTLIQSVNIPTGAAVTVTSTMTLVFANCTTVTGCTYTLPSASANAGLSIKILKDSTNTSSVTVQAVTPDLIGGTTAYWFLPTVNNSVSLVSDGTNWMCPEGCVEPPALIPANLEISNTATAVSSSQTLLTAISVPYWITTSTCTVSIGNVQGGGTSDCGIYDANFHLLAHSGSISHVASTNQKYTWAPINLAPGTYYLGFKSTSTTAVFFRCNGNQSPQGYSISSNETSTTLPDPENSHGVNGNGSPCVAIIPWGGSQI